MMTKYLSRIWILAIGLAVALSGIAAAQDASTIEGGVGPKTACNVVLTGADVSKTLVCTPTFPSAGTVFKYRFKAVGTATGAPTLEVAEADCCDAGDNYTLAVVRKVPAGGTTTCTTSVNGGGSCPPGFPTTTACAQTHTAAAGGKVVVKAKVTSGQDANVPHNMYVTARVTNPTAATKLKSVELSAANDPCPTHTK